MQRNFSVIIVKDFFDTEHEIRLYTYEIVNINEIGKRVETRRFETVVINVKKSGWIDMKFETIIVLH